MICKRVAAVVVTHSQPRLARACLASLQPLVTPDVAVIVVNAPGEVDPRDLRDLKAYGTVITNEKPRGYGENLNRGAAAAAAPAADYLLLLNDDVIFSQGAAEHLLTALDADARAGVSAPSIRGPDGSPQPSVFAFPSIRSEVLQAATLPSRIADVLRATHAATAAPGPPQSVDWVLGAAMLVRRRAFADIGGFDTGYFLYSEETDLCSRMHRRGWDVLSCGDAVVTHLASASTSDERFARMMGRSRARYVRHMFSARRQFALALALISAYAWNVLYFLVRALLAPAGARAKWDLLLQHWRVRTLFQRGERSP